MITDGAAAVIAMVMLLTGIFVGSMSESKLPEGFVCTKATVIDGYAQCVTYEKQP